MAGSDDEPSGADDEDSPKGPPSGPPSGPPKSPGSGPPRGPPMGMPMGMMPGMMPPGMAPPQRSGPPSKSIQEEDEEDEEDEEEGEDEEETHDDSSEDFDDDDQEHTPPDVDGVVGEAVAATPISETDALRAENDILRAGISSAMSTIDTIEDQPMPPIVGDGFVVPAHVVGSFVRIGRQLQRDGLCHGTSGRVSMLSLDEPNLIHMTAQGAPLGHLDERCVVSGRLGQPGPQGAGNAWRLHTILLAAASLENNGRAACIHVPAPYTTTMSLEQDLYVLRPLDISGKERFESVVIVDSEDSDDEDFLRQITEGLQQSGTKAVVVRGDGVYAVGADFDAAWDNAAAIEHSMKISFLSRVSNIDS